MKRFEELEKYSELNPIREHISLHFEIVEEGNELDWILKDIKQNFKIDISRVIVFCSKRNTTEQSAQICNDYFTENDYLMGKAAYYHAGMDADSRNRVFNGYTEGKFQILFATKAFGMGMDIQNIHHVYHLEPSSSFEDYLQEVGRAGRNAKMSQNAGYSKENPIKAICVYNKDSFADKVDFIQKTQSSWNDLCNVFEVFKSFRSKFFSDEVQQENFEYLPMPLNIIGISNQYEASKINIGGLFRLSLYWLEKTSRISSRYNTPAYIEFKNEGFLNNNITEQITDERQKVIFQFVYNTKINTFNNEESTLVDGFELSKLLKVDRDTLFSIILNMQQKGYLELINKIKIDLTESGQNEIRIFSALRSNRYNNTTYQFLEGLLRLGNELLDTCKENVETDFDLNYLTSIAQRIQQEIFVDEFLDSLNLEDNYNASVREYLTKKREDWGENAKQILAKLKKENPDMSEIVKFQRKIVVNDQFTNRLKFIFHILGTLDGVKIISKFSDNAETIQQAIIISDSKRYLKEKLSQVVKDTAELYTELSNWETRIIDINEFLLRLNIKNKSYSYLDILITCLKKIGYAKMFGSLIPMAIEMKFNHLDSLNDMEGDSVIKEEYIETIRLKKLRLCVLNAFTEIRDKSTQEQFVQEYFKSSNSSEIIELIEKSVNPERADEILRSYRADALESMVNGDQNSKDNPGLNEEQKEIYSADIRKNLSVIAGPGTGKTHTLVLRIARLIQEESISPGTILVLAYNRAVAEELKIRLRELFTKLGYKSLINSLQIYTFHGLMGAVLKQNGIEVELRQWEFKFIELYKKQGRRCLKRFENVQYVFVDEFQDITENRLNILKYVAPKERVYLTVIGDPNQSIYGYERVEHGGSRSPDPYYDEFDSEYLPDKKCLIINYRSTEQIINASQSILGYETNKLQIEPFKTGSIESVVKLTQDESWIKSMIPLVQRDDVNETAVLYRTNEELYRDYYKFKYLGSKLNIRVEIIGNASQFKQSREISRILEVLLNSRGGSEIDLSYVKEKVVDAAKKKYENWDVDLLDNLYLLFEYFLKNYGSKSTYIEFEQFLNEISSRDDGQLFNILKKRKINQEKKIILTTIHRAKGLEYDMVIVPTSFAKLPFDDKKVELTDQQFIEALDEEKRLLYVAYSRAKKYLILQHCQRERSLLSCAEFHMDEQIEGIGIPLKNKFGLVKISWKAKEGRFEEINNSINKDLRLGEGIFLKKDQFNNLYLAFNGGSIEQFTSEVSEKFKNSEYHGLYVDSIVRYTFDQCKSYDEKKHTQYHMQWCEAAKKQGYIYLVSFYGYAQEKSVCHNEKKRIERDIDSILSGLDKTPKLDEVKPGNHGKRWEEEEIKQLKFLYSDGLSVELCAEKLERKPSSIASKLMHLDLLKDEYWIKELEKFSK
jgi:superfamily I DNA/RNA helicase